MLLFVRVRQIDEIARVRQYLPGRIGRRGQGLFEVRDFPFRQGFAHPLALVLHEERETCGANGERIRHRRRGFARRRDVWADEPHRLGLRVELRLHGGAVDDELRALRARSF